MPAGKHADDVEVAPVPVEDGPQAAHGKALEGAAEISAKPLGIEACAVAAAGEGLQACLELAAGRRRQGLQLLPDPWKVPEIHRSFQRSLVDDCASRTPSSKRRPLDGIDGQSHIPPNGWLRS